MNESAALPGPKLKAERERRGLSAQKAADEMHLDRWVIDALEGDDYARIGPTVYAKGHLKKYAALLGLPSAEVLAGFDARAQPRLEPQSAGPSMLLRSRDDESSSGRSSLIAIACAARGAGCRPPVVASLARARQGADQRRRPRPRRRCGTTGCRFGSGPRLLGLRLHPPWPATTPAAAAPGAATIPVADNAAANAAAAPAQPPPGAGRARLRLSFSADSWVDIHDAAGRRTFAGNGLANSVKTISGAAPLRVYLGFGSGVQLEINDRAVAIGPQFFAGDVARFEAGADGVLRRDSRPDQTHGAPPRSPRPPG